MAHLGPASFSSAGTTCQCIAGRSLRYFAVSAFSYLELKKARRQKCRRHSSASALKGCKVKTLMCGICGQYNYRNLKPVRRREIEAMTKSIDHRGPDDEGYLVDGPLGFGFRRLSIIDLAGGHQPMSDAEETVWIIFNGEIYNYRELRAELQSKGHQFRTNSDTEVIIHGYKEWGTDVFNHLNGMFGLAIWDVRNERLVVARDAMGIKLVYYRLAHGRLTFGSEICAVLAADGVAPQVDAAAVNLFLRFRYTPSPYTIFKGVRKLAAGTLLVVEKGRCREQRWYNFVPTPFATP